MGRPNVASVMPSRLGRTAVIYLVLALLVLIALFSLERVGVEGGTSIDELLPIAKNEAAVQNRPANPGKSQEHERHCTDDKGQDDNKNPHCRELSPG